MRQKVTVQLIASKIIICTYEAAAVPCQLCSGARKVTRTIVTSSYLGTGGGYKPEAQLAVCYKCLARVILRRDRERPYAELRLYAPKRARRLAREVPKV